MAEKKSEAPKAEAPKATVSEARGISWKGVATRRVMTAANLEALGLKGVSKDLEWNRANKFFISDEDMGGPSVGDALAEHAGFTRV